MPALGWIDWALLSVLLLSVLVGLWRGLVFELLSLVGWLVAWFGAQWLQSDVAAWLPFGTPGGAINRTAAFVVAFVGLLVAWSLLSRLVRLLVAASPLSAVDRTLGAGFGLLRGLVVLLVLATAITLTPARASPSWQASHGAMWLNRVLDDLAPVLPAWARQRPAHAAQQ
ncbi:CvpA family protein [Aquabacterium sp. J223]|uniref:CvpA family protein n=1 Tax=Aquabacterium sp. J223 TaxID=2898431 RepID=UPI0021AE2126|nr:CvpA family protein [Aquabacterium sp. J223]UUX94626.1 CvpA family protein [Aquabacterium sp. J223]